MTQQPFSRPGAIDLSALNRPAPQPPAAAPGGASPAPAPEGSA
jgi:putative thioredoxin